MGIVNTEEDRSFDYVVGALSQDTFDITFSFTYADEVGVLVDGVEQSGFAVVGAGVKTGEGDRYVTLTAAVSNAVVTVYDNVRPVRRTNFATQGVFSSRFMDLELDRMFQWGQAFQERRDASEARAIRVPPSDNSVGALPAAPLRASTYLAFDTSGNPIVTNLGASITSADILLDFVDEIPLLSLDVAIKTVRCGGRAAPGDRGHSLYVRAASEPAHAGKRQDAAGAWFELVEEDGYAVEQFGAVGDGVADDVTAIQDCIYASDANVGVGAVVRPLRHRVNFRKGQYAVSARILVPWNIELHGNGAKIIPTQNVNVVESHKNSVVKGLIVDTQPFGAGFTMAAFALIPESPSQGEQYNGFCWSDCHAKFTGNNGTGFLMEGSIGSNYLQYFRAENLSVLRGAVGLELRGRDLTAYCNGNIINGLIIKDSQIAVHYNKANGNVINGMGVQRNTAAYAEIRYTASEGNVIGSSIVWDAPKITFDKDSNGNTIRSLKALTFNVTDLGRDNVILSAGGVKTGQTSEMQSSDRRWATNGSRGRIDVIEDHFLGAPNSKWTETLNGGTGTFSAASEGNAAGARAWINRYRLAPAVSNHSRLDFANNRFILPEHRPKVQIICTPFPDTDGKIVVGLSDGAGALNNLLAIELDPVNKSGSQNAFFVTRSGGSVTQQDLGQAFPTTAKTLWVTMEMHEGRVWCDAAYINIGAGGQSGDMTRGIVNMLEPTSTTHIGRFTWTTQIPNGTLLQPMCYVARGGAGAAWLDMIHFSCRMGSLAIL